MKLELIFQRVSASMVSRLTLAVLFACALPVAHCADWGDRARFDDYCVHSILADKGFVWCLTPKWLMKLDKATNSVSMIPLPETKRTDNLFICKYEADEKLWVIVGGKIFTFDTKTCEWTSLAIKEGSLEGTPRAIVSVENFAYIASTNGLLIYDISSGKISLMNTSAGTISEQVTCLLQDGETLWVGTVKGLYLLNLPDNSVKRFDEHEALKSGHISCLGCDQNSIFVSSGRTILVYSKTEKKWQSHTLSLPRGRESVVSFVTGATHLWLRVSIPIIDDWGIITIKFDKATGATEQVLEISGHIRSTALDPSRQHIWVGVTDGLWCLDLSNKKIEWFVKKPEWGEGVRGIHCRLSASSTEWTPSTDIEFTIEILNATHIKKSVPVHLCERVKWPRYIVICFETESGNAFSFCAGELLDVGSVHEHYSLEIQPNELLQCKVHLNQFHEEHNSLQDAIQTLSALDKFTVRAKMEVWPGRPQGWNVDDDPELFRKETENLPDAVWRGKMLSNTLTIKVKER